MPRILLPHRLRRPGSSAPALLALALLVLPVASRAGNQVWTGTAPRAKSIEAIARDPLNPNRMWAAAFGSGVLRTVDGGATWTSSRTGLLNTFVRCLAVQPHHPDSLYCGTNDGVFLSADGGTTWHGLLATTVSVRGIAIHPIRTGTIYAGTYGTGIYKSLNGGSTWSQINLGLVSTSVRDIALNPVRPDTLLAATSTGGGVHRSFNGGLTWAPVPDTAATNGAAEQVQWDPLDSQRAYVAELDRGMLKTSDGGNTWFHINRSLTSFRGRALAVVDTVRYFGTDGQGVFFTTISDTLWHPVNTGITSLVVDALSAKPGTSVCWAGTDGGGVFATSNRGATWSQLDGGLLNTFCFSLAVRPSTHRVYAGMGFGDRFWASSDQGTTWTRATTLVSHDSEHGVLADPLDGNRVYLSAYGSGVYRSDDDGATWARLDSLTLTNKFVRDLVAWPGQSGHLFVGTGAGPFESTDGAVTWVSRQGNLPAAISVRSLALVPGAPPILFIGSDTTGVWRSNDGGTTWARKIAGLPVIPALFIHALQVDATVATTVYAATDSGVYKSVNSGDTWSRARTGLPVGDVVAIAQDVSHPTALFCAVNGAGVFQSLNGGGSWSAVFSQNGLRNLRLRSLAVDGALLTLYAGSDNGVASASGYAISTTAVGPDFGSAAPLRTWPNPVRAGALSVELALARSGRVRATVLDVAGATVRTLADGVESAGPHAWSWDLRDAAGHRVAQGLYFLRVAGPAGVSTRRIAVLDR